MAEILTSYLVLAVDSWWHWACTLRHALCTIETAEIPLAEIPLERLGQFSWIRPFQMRDILSCICPTWRWPPLRHGELIR